MPPNNASKTTGQGRFGLSLSFGRPNAFGVRPPHRFFFKGLRRLLADNGQSVENVSMNNDGVDDIQTVAVFTQGFYHTPNVTNSATYITLCQDFVCPYLA